MWPSCAAIAAAEAEIAPESELHGLFPDCEVGAAPAV